MIWLPILIALLLLVCWCAMGAYALREYSYSRLEEVCERRGRPEWYSLILKQQDGALLALELLLSLSTMAVAAVLCIGIGWPRAVDAVEHQRFPWDFILEYTVFVLALLFAARVVPWTLARVVSEPFLFRSWPAIRLVQILFSPVLILTRGLDRLGHRMVGRGEPEEDDAAVLGEEIRSVVDEGHREGYLEPGASVMIHRVMELQDEDVASIMTPRTAMVCIDVDDSLEVARQKLIESGHSRVPVIQESADDIIGILFAKDLLRALQPDLATGRFIILRDILREPKYIPDTTGIPALLEMMQRQHFQIAIVTDEYGGVAGLVTMEDILEEIVGEIADEYDEEETEVQIQNLAPSVMEVDARVHIDDLNRQFEYGIPEDGEYDTIGGFVFSQIGRVPTEGETLDWNHLRFTVVGADLRKINRLRIEPVPAASPEEPPPLPE